MKKAVIITVIASLLIAFQLHGQDSLRYQQMDRHARNAPKVQGDSLSELVAYLIRPAANDFEKARSLYSWLIHNIQFDQKAYRDGNRRLNHSLADILRRRKAVCFGYAQLYQALCREAGLPCEIVSGYAKTGLDDTAAPDSPNHAWNAVQLEGQWYLLDATWASNLLNLPNEFMHHFQSSYFLTAPELFILEHLPADPMWQLLPCPVDATQFQLPARQLHALTATLEPCLSVADSLLEFALLSPLQKQLKTAFNAYRFLPSQANARELGATYMDYEYYLSEYADTLQAREQYDSLLLVQREMLILCEKAEALDFLFDSQRENCAYTHMNYATALSGIVERTKDGEALLMLYEEMALHFQTAAEILQDLPLNMFSRQALERCEEYLKWLDGHLQK